MIKTYFNRQETLETSEHNEEHNIDKVVISCYHLR